MGQFQVSKALAPLSQMVAQCRRTLQEGRPHLPLSLRSGQKAHLRQGHTHTDYILPRDGHMLMFTLKGLHKLLTCSSHTRCVFTNGGQDQTEHRVYGPYYSLSEQKPNQSFSTARQAPAGVAQTEASETKRQAEPGDGPCPAGK